MTDSQRGQTQRRLVYLDTWTLSTLARALRSDARRFRQFRDVWQRTGSLLALSRTHLFELRRHKDPDVRASRYGVIASLLPARFDMLLNTEQPALNALVDREIGVQVLHHLGRGEILQRVDRYWVGFPLTVESDEHIAMVREQLEGDMIGDVLDLFHSVLGLASGTNARDLGTPYARSRLSSVPPQRPTADQIDQALSAIDSELEKLPFWEQAKGLPTEEQLADGLSTAREQLRGILLRAQEVGFHEALREGDAHNQSRRNEFFDVHLQNRSFSDSVRSIVSAVSKVTDHAAIDLATQGISRSNCPGLWLRDAVELELRKSKHRPEPNDWFDLDHLTHLPYVDLQFADREIATTTRQVLKRKDQLPAALQGVNPPVATEASLEAVERELERAALTSSESPLGDD
jgi:hypothetical protein